MFERFTAAARGVVAQAQDEARALKHPYIGTEHFLLALADPGAGIPHAVLTAAGVDGARLRSDIDVVLGRPSPPLGEEDAAALRTIGIDLDAVLSRIEEQFGPETARPPQDSRQERGKRGGLLGRLPRRSRGSLGGHLPLTNRAKKVLELSLREAVALGSASIGSEHILLGMLREGHGLAAHVLEDEGISLQELRRSTLAALDQAA